VGSLRDRVAFESVSVNSLEKWQDGSPLIQYEMDCAMRTVP